MIDLETLAQQKESLKAAKEKANQKVKEARQAASKARGEAKRAVGQKLPNAAETQELADAAERTHKQADAEYRAYNDAYQAILKEESDAIKENRKESEINSVLSSYDVTITESDEYLGVFYDDHQRYVGFDIGIGGRAEASFNVGSRDELEKIIVALTGFAQRMP